MFESDREWAAITPEEMAALNEWLDELYKEMEEERASRT